MPSRSTLALALSVLFLSSDIRAQENLTAESLASLPRGVQDLKGIEARVRLVLDAARECTVGVGGGGSGVIVSPDGIVMTAAHVGSRAGRKINITFRDGRSVEGETLGNFAGVDAGLARITEEGPWPYAERAPSGGLTPGDWCFALGYPATFARDKNPPLRLGRIVRASETRLTTDCMIMGGDSGGPLFDLDGRVIGIHSSAGGRTGNNHVPSDVYAEHWERLMKGEDWGGVPAGRPPKFGIKRDSSVKDGVAIAEVTPDSPAAQLGLEKGDVIVSLNGTSILTYARLVGALRLAGDDGEVTLEVRRGDKTLTLVAAGEPEDERMPNAPEEEQEPQREQGRGRTGRPSGGFGGRFRVEPRTQRDQAPLLDTLASVIEPARRSSVEVLVDGKEVALGTIVNTVEGRAHLFAPASVIKEGKLQVRVVEKGEPVDATVIARHAGFDLALVQIPATEFTVPVVYSPRSASEGSILLSVGTSGRPVGFGVVSTEPRPVRNTSRNSAPLPVYFGATLADAENQAGILVQALTNRGPMERAGFQANDIIRSIGGAEVKSRDDLPKAVEGHEPDDEVDLVVVRDGMEVTQPLIFGRPPQQRGPRGQRGNQNTLDRWGGGPFSTKRAGFEDVIAVDTYLAPENCGGPVVDLDGRVVGIHLSRSLRVTTYTIPGETLRNVYAGLLAPAATTTEETVVETTQPAVEGVEGTGK